MSNVHRFIRLRSKATGAWYVDPELRQRLIEDAESSDSNMNDVAVRILAARFNVKAPVDPGRKSPTKALDQGALMLNIPETLNRAIERARIASGIASVQDVIRPVLCEHYGLRVPPPPQRGRAAAARR